MSDPTRRPLDHLRALMAHYPDLPQLVDHMRAGKGAALPDWPDWCFVPMAGWHAITMSQLAGAGYDDASLPPALTLGIAADLGRLAALGTWRYTQGVYVIDPELRAALEQTDIAGILPADVLTRLPEWCLYLATPGMTTTGADLEGVFVHLECDARTGGTELRLLLDTPDALVPVPIHLGPHSLREALDRTVEVARRNTGIDLPDGVADELLEIARPIVSMLLYLCSEEPEIDSAREPGSAPHNPAPKRVKRGWRLFAPDHPTVWTVGQDLGATLRAERPVMTDTGRTLRPHIRRGHWHGYWTGPRSGTQRFVYHWLPPMVVADDRPARDADE